jgi:antirestriction protein ArdC
MRSSGCKHEGLLLKPTNQRRGQYSGVGVLTFMSQEAEDNHKSIAWHDFPAKALTDEYYQKLDRFAFDYYTVDII